MTQQKDKTCLEELQEVLIDHPTFLKDMVGSILQEILDTQFKAHIGALRYERTEEKFYDFHFCVFFKSS